MTLVPYNHHPNSGWTEVKTEELKTLCDENLTATEIGKKLKFSRSAIIGKISRLKLPWDRTRKHLTPLSKIGRPKTVKHLQHKRQRPTFEPTPPSSPTEPIHFEATSFDNSIPQDQRKTVLQLTGHTCRWPIGDPGQPDFFFCGAYTNHIYCRHHAMRAYR